MAVLDFFFLFRVLGILLRVFSPSFIVGVGVKIDTSASRFEILTNFNPVLLTQTLEDLLNSVCFNAGGASGY